MTTIATSGIPSEELDALEAYANTQVGPALRDVLDSLIQCARGGDDLRVIDDSATLTPNQVADRLGMSRSHLYKLLDRGEIVFHRVGRDRRIRLRDLAAFEDERQRGRRELAERFAKQDATRAAADNELADLL